MCFRLNQSVSSLHLASDIEPIRVEVQCQKQILAAGAGNAFDIAAAAVNPEGFRAARARASPACTPPGSVPVKTDVRPARKRPTDEDVLSRQHGGGKATELSENSFADGFGLIEVSVARRTAAKDLRLQLDGIAA
jgi:hypothetical protein